MGDDQTQIHTAFLRIRFRFLDNQFNNPSYFASFDRSEVNWISKLDRPNNEASARLLSTVVPADRGSFTAIVMLEFSTTPEIGDRLVVILGPIANEHTVSDASFKWITDAFDPARKKTPIPWATAFAEVNYEMQRPDWLTITDAQLLRGRDGVALLRATVNNPTP